MPRYKIDNNPVEKLIRPTAVGKKNWLFIGHPDAGWRIAVIYSLLITARRHGLDPAKWLEDVLRRIPTATVANLHEFAARELEACRGLRSSGRKSRSRTAHSATSTKDGNHVLLRTLTKNRLRHPCLPNRIVPDERLPDLPCRKREVRCPIEPDLGWLQAEAFRLPPSLFPFQPDPDGLQEILFGLQQPKDSSQRLRPVLQPASPGLKPEDFRLQPLTLFLERLLESPQPNPS